MECEGGSNVKSEHHIKRTTFSSINGIATKSCLKRLYMGPHGWLQLFFNSLSSNSNIPGIHQLILTTGGQNMGPDIIFYSWPVERAEFAFLVIIKVAM